MRLHPEEPSHAILKGIRREVQCSRHFGSINNMEVGRHFDEPELIVSWEFVKRDDAQFSDEYIGIQLDTEATHAAMQEELKYMEELGLWIAVPPDQGHQRLGTAPIPTRWILCNKGDDEHPEIRVRLVVQETRNRSSIEADDIASTFSSTPPVEAPRCCLSMAMTLQSEPSDPIMIKQIDHNKGTPSRQLRELYVLPPRHMVCAD